MRCVIAWIPVWCATGLLSACATPMFTMPPGSPDYQVGFHDGCEAGYAFAGSPFYQRIDHAEPPKSEGSYFTGWHAGFEKCKGNYNRIQRTISIVLGPP
jgi:hypothetical protein